MDETLCEATTALLHLDKNRRLSAGALKAHLVLRAHQRTAHEEAKREAAATAAAAAAAAAAEVMHALTLSNVGMDLNTDRERQTHTHVRREYAHMWRNVH